MIISAEMIAKSNAVHLQEHKGDIDYLSERLDKTGYDVDALVTKIGAFQVATPSWAPHEMPMPVASNYKPQKQWQKYGVWVLLGISVAIAAALLLGYFLTQRGKKAPPT